MPLYLADTSAWNRSSSAVDTWEALLEANEIALCAPVRLELLYSARGKSDYAELARDYRLLPDLVVDERVTALAERTQATLAERSQHRGPRPFNLLVAAVAQVHDAILLHHDRHFDAIARVTGQPMEWLPARAATR